MKKGRRENIKQAYRPKPPFRIVEGMGTEPFNRLSPWACWALGQFYRKFTGRNRADLSLTYGEVKRRMSNLIYIRAVWELVGYGFIDIKRFGRLERNASLYALSDRWRGLDSPQKCDEVGAVLEEIKILQREKGVSCKRGRLCVLRNRLLGREQA